MKNTEIKNEVVISNKNDITALAIGGQSKQHVFTNITDGKLLFNLENKCDHKLNDCKGKELTITRVLIKVIEKDIEEFDDDTGEVETKKDVKKICILVDKDNKSYVTASKIFTNQMIKYIDYMGLADIEKGLKIRIIEKEVTNSSNKALGFELL